MTNTDDFYAHEVIASLRALELRLDEIIDAIADKRTISPIEKNRLRSLLVPLKADIKAASKRQKIDNGARPPNYIESTYYAPAMRSAAANFRIATNSHPINSGWLSCLFDVRTDINYFLDRLERQFPHI